MNMSDMAAMAAGEAARGSFALAEALRPAPFRPRSGFAAKAPPRAEPGPEPAPPAEPPAPDPGDPLAEAFARGFDEGHRIGLDQARAEIAADAAAREALALSMARIDQAKQDNDTLGGVVEVLVHGLVPGLGSHVQWDRKLDALLAPFPDGAGSVGGEQVEIVTGRAAGYVLFGALLGRGNEHHIIAADRAFSMGHGL